MKIKLLLASVLLFACPKNGDQTSPKANPDKAKATPDTSAAAASSARLEAGTVVATWEGGQMTYGELIEKRKSVFSRLRVKQLQELYTTEQRELEAYIVEELIKSEAAKKSQTQEEYLGEIARAVEVSQDDILQFYEARVKASGQTLEQSKAKITAYLMNMKQQEAIRGEFKRLADQAKVDMRIPPPEGVVVKFELAGRPMRGKDDAKITIVEFSDFECPFCDKARLEINKVVDAYPNDVKFYFLHFPLTMHPNAKSAAIAAECANRQGKFWEVHDLLFMNQNNLNEGIIRDAAVKGGADQAKLDACMKDPAIATFVDADMKQGEEAGVEGTPSFFINGVHYDKGIPTVEAIKAIIEKS